MLLRVYSKTKTFLGHFDAFDQSSLCITQKLDMDDKSLSFTAKRSDIANWIELEGYIQILYDDNGDIEEYVIREINIDSSNKAEVVAQSNVEELQGTILNTFTTSSTSIYNSLQILLASAPPWSALTGTETSSYTKQFNYEDTSVYDILKNFQTLYGIEYTINTKTKTIRWTLDQRGNDIGTYFSDELNLKSLSIDSNTYDLYTELEAYGKDGLSFASINSGNSYKNYVTNYTFTSKKKRYIMTVPEITEDYDLLLYAYIQLAKMAVPYRSYRANIVDIYNAAANRSDYSYLKFSLGDRIILIDSKTNTNEKQRIVEMTTYPEAPDKNTITLANKTERLTDLLSK